MDLKNLIAKEKTTKVDFPGCDGFELEIAYLSRDAMLKIRNKCMVTTIDKKTREPIEKMDEDLFVKIYIDKVLKGWKGLKFEYLKELVPLEDTNAMKDDDLIPFTAENAEMLISNAPAFDNWLTKVVNDVANFN